ncbi:excinuclease ABC subunit UvrC [uncultured Granulicatella sp.]|uniref:excinuclease ABC subunit UvrC n=1 Tax=uncultured Granulicatella sp. TaxID=316089 RepID=UPI00261A2AD0|nr:excinuclease ABC subunit UvrC [uncultured Granulicatella sp.]
MASELIESKLKNLPDLPGCYIMRNSNDEIIYIGKAKNLKNRVRSYFRGAHDTKTEKLVSEIHHFEYIVTKTNKESLLLEINLIKKYQPYYNIKLKQGTMYPYLKITSEKDPQLIISHKVEKDGGIYFGPYPNVTAATSTQQLIQKIYPLRKCGKNETRACFYYHLGQCIGCCDHEISEEEYKTQIKRIQRFLNGDVKTIKDDLNQRILEASERLEFEKAMDYRNQIQYIEATVEKQNIMSSDFTNRDVFAYFVDRGWISIQVFLLRQSTIIKREAAMFPIYDQIEDEVLSFIIQFYQDQNHILPKEILVPDALDVDLLSETLGVKAVSPKRGSKKRMLDLATQNSEISLLEKFRREEQSQLKTLGALEELAQALGLEKLSVIESFDHSNIQGTNPVSAMVVFRDGKPDRKHYRKFKVKTVLGSHEFATTQEVIRRRYSRLLREKADLPDLILMDGGKIQMKAAMEVLEDELGLTIPVCGMVKNDKHKTASLIYGEKFIPIEFDRKGQAFQLIQRVQEEVHRFAITFHRQVRSKNTFSSKLELIDGVGPKTRKKLLSHFKTTTAIKNASVEELQKIGISEKVASNIMTMFQNE